MTMAYTQAPPPLSRPAYMDNLYKDALLQNFPPTPPASLHSYKSSISTTSTASNHSLRSAYQTLRPLSPPIEECGSDTISIRSKKSLLGPRRMFRLGNLLHRNRNTYPQTSDESQAEPIAQPLRAPPSPPAPSTPPTSAPTSAPTSPGGATPAAPAQHRPSLPKLQTNFSPSKFGPPEAIGTYEKRALPALPVSSQPPSRSVSRNRSHSKRPLKRHASSAELSGQGTDLGCQQCYYFVARHCNGYVLGGDSGDACETCLSAGFFGAN